MIPFCGPDIGKKEAEYVANAISSGWIGSKGAYIEQFEEKFAKYIGVDYAITCSSGTAALQLAYIACGLNAQCSITVPYNTFIATKNMAVLMTHEVIQAREDTDTWNLNLREVTSQYACAVHLYGNPVDMGFMHRAKFTLIEDCAQSLGSRHRWKKCGAFGKASIFSFHSAKMLTTGEGGMVCTDDKKVAEIVRAVKNQCMTEPYKHNGLGFNFRMTNMQAAMGLAQLERIEELIAKKRNITRFYNENLSEKFIRQKDTAHSFVVKWANAYKVDGADSLRSILGISSIETRPGFLDNSTIVLPSGTTLTADQLEKVVVEANTHA